MRIFVGKTVLRQDWHVRHIPSSMSIGHSSCNSSPLEAAWSVQFFKDWTAKMRKQSVRPRSRIFIHPCKVAIFHMFVILYRMKGDNTSKYSAHIYIYIYKYHPSEKNITPPTSIYKLFKTKRLTSQLSTNTAVMNQHNWPSDQHWATKI